MKTVFLSYSSRDYFFAEMLAIKLKEANYGIWRDQGSIRAGDDWRQTIEEGIRESFAIVVALSDASASSAFVTFEWAYAMGMEKPVIPIKLSDCTVHPKLEPTQYIDFSYPRSLPWQELLERLEQIDTEETSTQPAKPKATKSPARSSPSADAAADEVLQYLNSHGFTMVSFERLRQRVGAHLTDTVLNNLITDQPKVFRHARIKGGKAGIAKRVP
jgi:hypothetical protein